MRRSTIVLPLTLGFLVALAPATGCRRAPRSGADRPGAGKLRAEQRRSPRTDPRLRPAAAPPTPAPTTPTKAPRPAPDPKGQPPTLKPDGPAPFTLIKAGAAPRLTLRYRFSNDDKLTWRTTMEQLTHVRNEKRCPPDPRAGLRGTTVRTIPMRYGVDLTTTVTRATDGLYQLDTRMTNVTMTLPSLLANQRQLLSKVLSGLSYTRRMSSRGQVTRFAFGKLTPKALLNLSERFKAPLSHLQPMLPAAPVGVGGLWQHRRQHALQQPGGRIDATYLTKYRLTAIRTQGGLQVVDIEMTTKVRMTGKLMRNPFTGNGSGSAQLTLDAARGVIRMAKGTMWICSAVKNRTSTNRTAFTQTLLPDTAATPSPKKRPPPRPSPMDTKPIKTR